MRTVEFRRYFHLHSILPTQINSTFIHTARPNGKVIPVFTLSIMTSDQHSDNNMCLSDSAWGNPGKRCHKACPQGWATWWTNSALFWPRQFLRESRTLKPNFAWIPCKMEQCFGKNRPDPVACNLDLLLILEVSLQYIISSPSFIPGAAQDQTISMLFMRRKKTVSHPLFKAHKYLK